MRLGNSGGRGGQIYKDTGWMNIGGREGRECCVMRRLWCYCIAGN